LPVYVETSRVAAGRADAERERLPPVVEARLLDADRKSAFLDLVQPCCFEQLRKMALAGARQVRLILDVGIELTRRLPEQADVCLPTCLR